ncbi:MAG: hypothetical protein NTU83_06470 [Candidatus Hydrogenedentes bacterium]|nr:hypothetical protein [Candidatus Hydrogenedentota bacterium]
MHIGSVTKVRPAPASQDQAATLEKLDVLSYQLTNILQATNIANSLYSLVHAIGKDIAQIVG